MSEQKVTREAIYNTSLEKLWQALTDKDQLQQWYFTIADFLPEPGRSFQFYEGPEKQFLHLGKIIEVIPQKKLQHTWEHPQHSKGSTLLTWELFPEGDKTRVVLTHTGIETLADGGAAFAKENYEQGWKEIMDNQLRRFLE